MDNEPMVFSGYCSFGKHEQCDGQAFDIELQVEVLCECSCHMGQNPCS